MIETTNTDDIFLREASVKILGFFFNVLVCNVIKTLIK